MSVVSDLLAAGSLVTHDATAIRVDLKSEDKTITDAFASLARDFKSVDTPSLRSEDEQSLKTLEKAVNKADSQDTKLDTTLTSFIDSEVRKSETQDKELLLKPNDAALKKDVESNITQLDTTDAKGGALTTSLLHDILMINDSLTTLSNSNSPLSDVINEQMSKIILDNTTSTNAAAKLDIDVSGLISALSGGTVVTGELLVNGGFETEPNFGADNTNGYIALTGNQIPGWTIEPGHAVTVHDTSIYPYISGNYSVNIDGEGTNGVNANFYQDFATAAGHGYQLKFDWQGWESTSVGAEISVIDTVTNAVLFDQTYAWDPALHHEVANFTGTGDPLRLRVQENPESGTNDNGYIVDNFSVMAT